MNNIFLLDEEQNFLKIQELAKRILPDINLRFFEKEKVLSNDFVIFNCDQEDIQDVIKDLSCQKISFGFSSDADFFASDEQQTEQGINFKLNHKGSIVPIWLNTTFEKQKISNALAVIAVGVVLKMNIVEISEKLKNL